jgi:hypothetical protein
MHWLAEDGTIPGELLRHRAQGHGISGRQLLRDLGVGAVGQALDRRKPPLLRERSSRRKRRLERQ